MALNKEYIEDKNEKFVQTVVFIRKENKNFLRSAAALQNVPMYVYLDEILTKHREVYLKKVVNPDPEPTNQNQKNQPELV